MAGFPKVLWHILDISEEDYCGLWEVVWRLNSLYPDEPADSRRATTKRVVHTLFERGWIELYECDPWPVWPQPESLPMEPHRRESILSRDKNWDAPEADQPTYWIATTEDGDQAYQSGSVEE